MTSAQTMSSGAGSSLTLLMAVLLLGCVTDPPRVTLHAPYEEQQLWAVVPPLNESGVSIL